MNDEIDLKMKRINKRLRHWNTSQGSASKYNSTLVQVFPHFLFTYINWSYMFRVEVLLCMSQTPRHRGRPQRLKARSVFTSNIVFFTVRLSTYTCTRPIAYVTKTIMYLHGVNGR